MENQVPPLAGLKEAAAILGWDRRKLYTYEKRGSFPKPVQVLACGPIWTVQQIEEYKKLKEIGVHYKSKLHDQLT